MWKSLAAGRESHARRQKTEEMATQQETGTDQVSHLDKNMTAMVQQCSVSMMTARDVQPSTSSFSQLLGRIPKNPHFCTCMCTRTYEWKRVWILLQCAGWVIQAFV